MMDGGTIAIIITAAGLVGGGIGWLFRQYSHRREARRQAAVDAGEALKEKRTHLEDMLSKTDEGDGKNTLLAQLDEVDQALLGFYGRSIRQTLQEGGLPAEKELIADGRSRMEPEQATRLEQAVAEVESLPPPPSSEDLFVLGNAYYYAERYQDAKDIYERILKSDPDNPLALMNRGVTYHKMDRNEEALADHNRSLELRPDDPSTLNNRGITYGRLERYEEALADYNRSLELKPDDPDTFYNRGITYSHQKRYEQALADYNRSLELKPDDPDTLTARGLTYQHLGRYEEALADHNRSLELKSDVPLALSGRGITYIRLSRYEEARDDFNRCLELRPDDPDVFFNLACLFSWWGKPDDALSYLEKAINDNEKYREYAKTDEDFDNIREDPRFKKLTESD